MARRRRAKQPKPPDLTFGKRMREAKRRYASASDPKPVYDRDIGTEVAKLLGRAPFSSQAVGRWLKGHAPDDLRVVAAIASVLGVPAGWLAFGEGSVVPPAADAGASGVTGGRTA